MEKRVVLFFILSFLIVVGYPYLMRQLGLMPEIQPVKVDIQEVREDIGIIEAQDEKRVAPELARSEGIEAPRPGIEGIV